MWRKIHWAKQMLMVLNPLKFSWKYFRVALATSAIKEKDLYSRKNFHGTLENCENCKCLAHQIFPRLW